MFRLYAIQARFGDCFLLEYGEAEPAYILLDGGPSKNFENHLKPALQEIMKGRNELEAVMVSHVDNDHILGVLDLFVEKKYQRDTNKQELFKVNQLWFNSFKGTIDTGDLEKRIKAINTIAGVNGFRMQEMSMAVNGIQEGHQLLSVARFLDVPINPNVVEGFYKSGMDNATFHKSNLKITIVGPTMDNLEKLRKKWEDWIVDNEQKIQAGQYTKEFAAMSDRSVPNLSSIVMLVEVDGKTLLLTGDCRGDHLLQGLEEAGLLKDGKFHTNIFKVPHHGSARNATKEFFSNVTADIYIISADGTYGNPDSETLKWIVEAAMASGKKIKIIFTNETESTKELIIQYPPENSGYEVIFLGKADHYLAIS